MLKKVIILLCFSAVIVACYDSYNSLYVEEKGSGTNDESSTSKPSKAVSIKPHIIDSGFVMLSANGTDSSESDSQFSQEQTKLHTFGLRTESIVGGGADYVSASQGNQDYYVLWNQMLGFAKNTEQASFLDDKDNVVKCEYNIDDVPYRYKFFALGTDDVMPQFRVDNNNQIIARVELDGSQDLTHTFAYHSSERYADALSRMDADAARVFATGGSDYMYNMFSGTFNIHPVFELRHLLNKFNILIRGGNSYNDGSCDFLNIFIRDIAVETVKSVDVLVADDSWERDSYCYAATANELMHPVSEPEYISISPMENLMRNTDYTSIYRGDVDYDFLQSEAKDLSQQIGENIIPSESYWVGSSNSDRLTVPVYLPMFSQVSDNVVLKLRYRYLYTHKNAETGMYHIGLYDENIYNDYIWQDLEEHIVLPLSDIRKGLMNGGEYTILITVYGKSVVMAEII